VTTRLYYRDCYLRSFDAGVVLIEAHGERSHVVLEATAFYPTSGGQPFDTGTLDGLRVLDVFENDGGEIVHVVDGCVADPSVHGEIDWARRFDHMQQHTGQHLLSAVFLELLGHATVSFHLGEETSTIDLATGALNPQQVLEAEQRANAVILEDRPVHISFRDSAELAGLGLRKQVKREGEVRLVEIEGLDLTACGGTHVARTSQIGALLMRKVEKVKQGTRVEFACGGRAARWARRDYDALTRAAALLTAGAHQLPELLAKRMEEQKAAEKERRKLQELLAAYEARDLVAQAAGDVRVVERTFDAADVQQVRFLAAQIAAQPRARAILAIRQPPTLILAQSKDVSTVDLGALVKQLGLRGGGSRDFAQAGAADWEAMARALADLSPILRGIQAR
jgi:alanyl-tRNA synthetase